MPAVWVAVIGFVFLKDSLHGHVGNNYLIFKYTFFHAIEGNTLYGHYPAEYGDKNHYGPLFSLIFAPYALLPDWLGQFIWVITIVLILLWAVKSLPLKTWQINGILLLCVNELWISALHVQFNILLAATIIFTFILIQNRKEFWAPLPILVSTFVKLYGIVGLTFFLLVKGKRKFILSCIFWSIILFIAPMIISSPGYVIDMYGEWYKYLVIKNAENVTLNSYQDISIMGFTRRVLGDPAISNLLFIIPGVILFGLSLLRFSQYKYQAYRLMILSSTLMFPIIFSSSSESPTYIIVFLGVAIWFVIQPRPHSRPVWLLIIFAILFGTLNTADIYPYEFRAFLRLHAVKALPCFLIWLRIIYEMLIKDFSTYDASLAMKTAIE